ncbi:hypothetical protein J2X69_002119 [Algoriphagus sp. 4150]|uniref:hypothetical protein n=1 Tax=Algoriphagus sp. 4150 TaxID=2817756 RepID=UPI002861E442|nr:hypothetical protein [Algoriphagus sp. 4150]MDR7129773.1 hypothetical protein [Algoriphagus sp. 4150]
MKSIVIFALLLLTLSTARANESTHRYPDRSIMMATCVEGHGCTFQLSAVTRSDLDIVHGTEEGYYSNLPAHAIMVSAKTKRGIKDYVETRYTRGQLDKLYGGDGYTMIYLFDPHIQPLDGEWVGEVGQVTSSACFVDVTAYISRFSGTREGGVITFPKPFQARFLMDNPNVKWLKISANKYRGLLNFGQSGGPMTMTYDAEIVNDKLISGMGKGTIRVPTKEPCHIRIPVTFRFIKPNQEQEEDDDQEDDPWETDDDLLPVNPKGDKDELLPTDRKKSNPLPAKPKTDVPLLDDADDELLPVNPKPKGDELLPTDSKNSHPPATKPKTDVPRLDDVDDDLLPVNPKPKGDELLPIKPKPTQE